MSPKSDEFDSSKLTLRRGGQRVFEFDVKGDITLHGPNIKFESSTDEDIAGELQSLEDVAMDELRRADMQVADIDRCDWLQYPYEESDDGGVQCTNIGVRLRFVDSATGRYRFQYRCGEHGWEPGRSILHSLVDDDSRR